MARDDDYWSRKEHYEKYGVWPEGKAAKEAKVRKEVADRRYLYNAREHSGIGWTVSDAQVREILDWHKNNPDNAKFDNDGNPVE